MVDEPEPSSVKDGDPADYEPIPGIHGFVSTVRLWMGAVKGTPFPALRYVNDTARRSRALLAGTILDPDVDMVEDLIQDLDYSVAEVVVPLGSDSDSDESISDSFDAAIQVIQHLQHALYIVRRDPFREATKELSSALYSVRYRAGDCGPCRLRLPSRDLDSSAVWASE